MAIERFGHVAQRLFNTPLALHPKKLDLLMAALAEQLGMARPMVLNPGAFFDDDDDDDFGRPNQTVRADHGYDLVGPAENIALIPVRGTLVQKLGSLRPFSGMTGYNGIRQSLYAALCDPQVESIAFDIDSPGGEVAGCFDLVDFIYQARGEKPMSAILTEKAYSAAYAIASAVDRIYVPRTGGVGSIGVICAHVDWSKALAENGIKVTYIHYGAKKVDGRPEIPLSDGALADLQAEIDAMGELFTDTVARNRGLKASAVRAFEAGCFLGAPGVEARLADQVLAPDAALQAVLADLA